MSVSLIAIDVGGSYIKSALLSDDGPINLLTSPTPLLSEDELGIKSYESNEIISRVIEHLENQSHIDKSSKRNRQIILSGQMGCFAITGSQDQYFENKIISWQSNPTLRRNLSELIAEEKEFLDRNYSGEHFRYGSPSFILKYLQLERREIIGRFETLLSLINSHLNKSVSEIHITDAASTGLFSLKENRWIEEVEEELQIEMPLVSHTFVKHMSGSYNEQLPGFADQQCSILGCKIDYDEVVLNLGTGGQLAQLSDKLDISENFQVRPFFDDKFIKTITHLPSGRFVNSIIRIVKNQKQEFSYKELDEIAHSVVLDSTLSQKELSSFEAQYQRKEIDTFEFLTHSISYIINNLVQNYKSLIPKSDTKIKIAGGLGQKMTFIKKLLSDRLDVEITISPEMETTLKGLHSLYLKQVRDAV